jgi:hypothetical protein
VSPALVELHWLSAADRVTFKVATLVYRCLHDAAPRYLSSALHLVADVDTRRRLRSSADTQILLTPRSRLVTAGDRSFQESPGPRIWNSLPSTVRAAPSLLSFKRQLKTRGGSSPKILGAWSPFPTRLWAIQIHRERALKESGGPEQQLGGGPGPPGPSVEPPLVDCQLNYMQLTVTSSESVSNP